MNIIINHNIKATINMMNQKRLHVLPLNLIVLFLAFIWSAEVLRAQSPCDNINLACNDLINVSINEDCYASINADLILEDPPFAFYPDNGVNYDIRLFDSNGFPIIPSNQVGEDQVGQTIKASITLVPCNISCWGYIHVEDKIGPKFWNCVDGFLPDIDIDCDEFSDGFVIPDPLLGGICDHTDVLSFEDDTTMLSCVDEFALTITRLWTAKDHVGNRSECQQLIRIRRLSIKEIDLPDDFIVTIDPDEDCNESQDVSPERTGYPTGIYCPNIKFFFSDIEYPQCGIQRKLLRDWFIMDWCTGQSVNYGQIIKIIDENPPRVICDFDTLMVPKANYSCFANPILNPLRIPGYDTLGAVTILDTCAEDIIVEVGFLPAEPGKEQALHTPYYNILPNEDGVFLLPEFESSAWIRYCFSDACGNKTQIPETAEFADSLGYCCYFQIDAKDQTPPTAICEGFTKVPLGKNGITEVLAESFDDHSFDPCEGISHFLVRRESNSCPGFVEHGSNGFSSSIHFCCEDLGDTITVRLRVFDNAGNFSDCLGLVCVDDPEAPDVNCPAAIVELDCGDDYRDYDLIGLPEAHGGCDKGFKLGKETFDLSDFDISCGTGSILRTIEIKDAQHKLIKICSQEIIYNADDISTMLEPGDFEFPDDITIDICQTGGSLDPQFTGIPESDKEFGCANIAISYKDSSPLTQNSFGVCYTILREWQVVDWCNYHPSVPNDHILKYTQEIRVINTAVPVFNCPNDLTVKTSGFECEAEVDLLINVSSNCQTSFNLEWQIDAFSDGVVDFTGFGNDASGVYPVGEHTISYTGRNVCGGNSASCTFRFVVEGDKPPVPVCLAELTWSLGAGGNTEVWASDFDLKSQGGCGLDELIFSFVNVNDSSYPQLASSFDCSDIPNGIAEDIQVRVYVIDESGRSASCLSTLKLQDSADVCPDSGNKTILSGEIHTEMLQALEQVEVELKDMHNESSMMNMTGLGGSFAFDGLISSNEYELKPKLDKDYLNGVSTLDLLIIQRHILGLQALDSPYKMIAADVDASGSISAIDLIQLRKLILGVYDDLPENESWCFVPESHKFTDAEQPWEYPSSLYIDNMAHSKADADFIAIKVGDVNSSVVTSAFGKSRNKNYANLQISAPSHKLNAGELYAYPIRIQQSIPARGLQIELSFNAENLLFQGVDDGKFIVDQDNFALLNSQEGKINFSFSPGYVIQLDESDILFTIYFEARKSSKLEEVLGLSNEFLEPEIYNSDFETIPLDMNSIPQPDQTDEFELFQNEPNPFSSNTRIRFYIPHSDHVRLSIVNASGKLLYNTESYFESGVHSIEIDRSDLDGGGILLYRLETSSGSQTRKMIMVK